jgi:hypothetical protein
MELVLMNVIFCDSVVPLPGSKLVCYGVFNDQYTAAYPFTCPHFAVLCSWSNGTGFHVQKLKLLNPMKSMIMAQSTEQYFTLNEETETAYVITDVNQVVFSEPGTYYLEVTLDNNVMGEYPIHFRKVG